MDQGNRALTGKLIQRLIRRGYRVDLVLQGGMDEALCRATFGSALRWVVVPPPQHANQEEMATRAAIRAFARQLDHGLSAPTAREIFNAANHFHPFQTLSPQIDEATGLLINATPQGYAAVICNYAYSLGAIAGIRAAGITAPVAVITHDALSRLDEQAWTLNINTAMRGCAPALEAEVLSLASVVVAISETERRYFQSIGVTAPIVLCEYDACSEMRPWRVAETACERQRLIFTGSRNDLNRLGLLNFLTTVWPMVRLAAPAARLVVTGTVCEHLESLTADVLDGVEVLGPLPREQMLQALHGSSIAINPTTGGTGLKIKTVEALALGLPSVVTSNAAEGLEPFRNQGLLVADSGPAMLTKVLSLLHDPQIWRLQHHAAIEGAEQRFSPEAVFGPMEKALWGG